MNLKPADIFFVIHKDNWISRMLAWFMESKWSHTGLVYEVTPNTIFTLETSDFEVTHQQLSDYLKDANVYIEIWSPVDLSDDERLAVVMEAAKQRKQIYGYLQLLSLGLRRVCMRVGIKIQNFFRQGVICCDVVLYGYQTSNILELHLDPESIDTQELYEKVTKSGKFTLVLAR